VPLGLELDDLLALPPSGGGLREALDLRPDHVVFGYIGRLVPIKGLPTLLEAFALALGRAPSARLVLVGDGPDRPALQEQVTALGLGPAVRFAGWRTDLPALYRTFDAVVLSSRNEGTPLAVIEAMAAGRPVVATSVGGVPDVVADGKTGMLVPPDDPRTLADALVALVDGPALRRSLGAAGRQAVGRYRSTRLVDDILNLYTRGLSDKRGGKSIVSSEYR
jgi:glycosyltransferase involved in cell wall biosynthesis